jgi:ABC-type transporter Mla maintaining outer membrane lipid asymmetry ATPase subunit MlaF
MSDIRLEGVTMRYGPVAAADNVDLAVVQGKFVPILGPSGVVTLLIGLTVLALAAVTVILARAGKLKQTIV